MNLTRWRTAGLLAGALIVGTTVGPPLAQAATAGLARIEGGGSANVAKVASTGQLQVAQADPKSPIAKYWAEDCHKGGIYKVPAGKALIITTVDFFNGSTSPSSVHGLVLTADRRMIPAIAANTIRWRHKSRGTWP